LAAGDLSRNGRAARAIGLPGAGARAGAALVMYGRSGGLKGIAAANDRFGHALAIGDFDSDGAGDLAVGVAQRARRGRGQCHLRVQRRPSRDRG
jgi:hypothetical protein